MRAFATILIFVGGFGVFFQALLQWDKKAAARRTAQQREHDRRTIATMMRGWWTYQAVLFTMFGIATTFGVIASLVDGVWQISLALAVFPPLAIWGVIWALRERDRKSDPDG